MRVTPYLDEYRNKFIEKYGVDREVPLLEMIRFKYLE